MVTQVEILTLREDSVGKCLRTILVKRALIEVLMRAAARAHEQLLHGRYQLSLQCGRNDPKSVALHAGAIDSLRISIDALPPVLESMAEAAHELDELKIVMEAPQVVPALAVLLEDNKGRVEEIGRLLKSWQESLDKAART